MGPNNPNVVLQETNDLSYFTSDGRETTGGSLSWAAGEAGPLSFTLNVKPRTVWEVAETFEVMIYDIQGFPATEGRGEASPTAGNVSLTVRDDF